MTTFVVSSSGKTLPGKEIAFHFQTPSSTVDNKNEQEMNEITIPLYVDMAVGIGGDTWPAAELFCDFLTSPGYYSVFCDMFRNKSVIELGSGNGLVGILIDKVFDVKRVSVTDMESHVPLIAHNLALNGCDSVSGRGHCTADAIDWMDYRSTNKDLDESQEEKFDVILALECVYREDLFEPLIRTIQAKSHTQTKILLGMTRAFVSPKFFQLLERYNFVYRKVASEVIKSSRLLNKRNHDTSLIGIFVIEKSPFTATFL